MDEKLPGSKLTIKAPQPSIINISNKKTIFINIWN